MTTTPRPLTAGQTMTELRSRGIDISEDQVSRCTQALWLPGEVRSGRGKPSRYQPHHVELLGLAVQLIDLTPGLTYDLVGLLRRHALKRGDNEVEYFSSLLELVRIQRGYDLIGRTA